METVNRENNSIDIEYINKLVFGGGLAIFPIVDGDKRPAIISWTQFQERRPTAEELKEWGPRSSWGVACGKASGNLEVLDFDEKNREGLYEKWKALLPEKARELLPRFPVNKTRNNGHHLFFRCDSVEKNMKLAESMNPETKKVEVLIETRGLGGIIVIPPSQGYEPLQGDILHIPRISKELRDVFLNTARLINEHFAEMSSDKAMKAVASDEERPSEFFDRTVSWAEILENHGCKIDHEQDGTTHWTRPEKERGTSITTGFKKGEVGKELCYVFTSNFSPLEPNKAYTKFQVFTLLNYKGDFTESAREIGKKMPRILNSKNPEAKKDQVKSKAKAITICAADVVIEEVEWLWRNRFPVGKISLIAGDPGLGKSFLTADMTARVSTGKPWVDGSPCKMGNVLFLSAEDAAADTIVPRLKSMDANLKNIHILEAVTEVMVDGNKERGFSLESDIKTLEDLLEKIQGVKLVIIDPITSYLGSGKSCDSHKNSDVRAILSPLSKLAERKRVAIVLVSHLNKSESQSAINRVTGSGAFVAAARVAYYVAKSPDDPDLKIFAPVKANLAPPMEALSYTIQSKEDGKPFFHWEQTRLGVINLDEFLNRGSKKEDGKLDEAKEVLAELIKEKPEWDRKELLGVAKGIGVSERTLDRAKIDLGIKTIRSGFGKDKKSVWTSPLYSAKSSDTSSPQNVGGIEEVGGIGKNIDISAEQSVSNPISAKIENGRELLKEEDIVQVSLPGIEAPRDLAEKRWLEVGKKIGWSRMKLDESHFISAGETEWRKFIAISSLKRLEDYFGVLEYELW